MWTSSMGSNRVALSVPLRREFLSGLLAVTFSLALCGLAAAQEGTAPSQEETAPQEEGTGGDTAAAADIGTIEVRVTAIDENGNRIDNAELLSAIIIRAEGEQDRPRFSITKADVDEQGRPIGKGVLRLLPDTYKLTLSSVSFNVETITVELAAGDTKVINIVVYYSVQTITERAVFVPLDRNEFSIATTLNQRFIERVPFNVGNRQSLPKVLKAIPGLYGDSLNQVHTRGENSIAKAVYVDGVRIPAFAAGRIAEFFLPDTISTLTARTGGLAPEFGGGSGAILDIKLRQPPANEIGDPRFINFRLGDGDFNTNDFYLGFGGASGNALGNAGRGLVQRFRYFFALSNRYTDEAAEAPQDSLDNDENYGASEIFFGKASLDLKNNLTVSALANLSSGRSGVVNRLGLNDSLKPFGSGFGFLGEKYVDGTTASQPTELGVANRFGDVVSQETLLQTFRQKDNNTLVMLQATSKSQKGDELSVAVGATESILSVFDNSPRDVDERLALFNQTGDVRFLQGNGTFLTPPGSLPVDNSIEYIPTVRNDYQQLFLQFDYSQAEPTRGADRTHRLKAGVVLQSLDGLDTYRFIPQSQLALSELVALDPRLAPPQFVGSQIRPTGRIDQRGNVEYELTTNTPVLPILTASRTGTYAAAYIQDTYKINPFFRINYGLRYETFQQETEFNTTNPDYLTQNGITRDTSVSELCPRLNINYVFRYGPRLGGIFRPIDNILFKPLGKILDERSIVRLSYNRLFAPPELGQGFFLPFQRGSTLQRDPGTGQLTQTGQAALAPEPQVVDQYDFSLERALNDYTFAQFNFFVKDFKNTLINRSALSPLQAGMISTYNLGDGGAEGIEFVVRTNPKLEPTRLDGTIPKPNPLSAYLAFSSVTSAPDGQNQVDNTGQIVRSAFYDFEQETTISAGASYLFPNGGVAGLSVVYGSGLFSSQLAPLPDPGTTGNPGSGVPNNPALRSNAIRNTDRTTMTEVNLRFATRPDFLYRTKDGRGLGIEFSVENLLDSQARLNFRGPIAGTRYQLGRRIFIALTGRL